MADRSGQQFGNYRLVRLLGQGGYAEVYLGQHLRLSQQAAIKVLHTHLTDSEAEHFQQEAQTISQLLHPSIIRVFDYDVQDGVPFLVMDYAAGGSLRQRYPKGNAVPLPQIVSYVKQVAEALQYAHEQKLIHRDVKPENMLLGRRDEVLLSDFGIATIAHSSGSLSTKEAVGTLVYMAPEQIEGHPRAASDQYALGCVVYEWLCGTRPFEGSPTEVMVQQLSMPPPPLHEKVTTIPLGVEEVVLRALAKDPKVRFASVRDFAVALELASQLAYSPTAQIPGEQAAPGSPAVTAFATVAMPDEALLLVAPEASPETPADPVTSPGLAGTAAPTATTPAVPLDATTPAPVDVPALPVPTRPRRRTIARLPAALLIGLALLVVGGAIAGSLGVLAHFGVIGTPTGAAGPIVAHGGTWTVDFPDQPSSLLPNASGQATAAEVNQALYLPLFYSDAQGGIHPGAASEVPTVQNGGISTGATIWTFHMRPGLVWSDGQPYDARDVDYTWKLWLNPAFGAAFPTGLSLGLAGLQLISSAVVSPDHLSITFHLKQPYVPFFQFWVDGFQAPLPVHHFSSMTPGQMAKSPDNLNPQVTSGPFLMAESDPGNHYTLARNPRYYQARQGLPYLDKVVFRIADRSTIPSDLQTGRVDSTTWLDATQAQQYEGLHNYMLVTPPTDAAFEELLFNFHNIVLASHPEVRTAIADAIDYQSLVASIPAGLATILCTDQGSFYHPGYDPAAPCPIFDPAATNQLLDNSGWVRGPDGVRSKDGQRLEFDYAANTQGYLTNYLIAGESIIKGDLRAIGIQLDIQNYNGSALLAMMFAGKASPPTGAVAGRYDIAELQNTLGYDPDDSSLLSCNQNLDYYCNHTLDALYQQEQETVVPGARQQIFAQIHQLYLTDFPFIVLYSPPQIALARKGTHNYQLSSLGIQDPNIWQWWCDGGKC
jgi:ABC-type transport system substrate-binding protein/tRNA A-37 threonylcarbamoyl transferase component Bud32